MPRTRAGSVESEVARALRRRLSEIAGEIKTIEKQLADLRNEERRLQQASELVGNGAHRPAASKPAREPRPGARASSRGRSRRRSRNPGSDKLLSFVREHGNVRVADVAGRYRVTALTARTWLAALAEQGSISSRREGRADVWSPADGGDAATPPQTPTPRRRRASGSRATTAQA